jgi:hypothetical protein
MNTKPTNILDCGHAESPHSDITTGYGIDPAGKKHCYACCADRDRADMIATGKATLYLVQCAPRPLSAFSKAHELTNWPGSLRFPATYVRISKRGGGFGSQRTDAYFTGPDGKAWHAVNRGDSQIARCRRLARPRAVQS